MRKKLLAVFAGVGLLILFGSIGAASAQEFRHGNSATVSAYENLDSSAYLAGRNIDVAGTIDGDLFCAGQNITISGTITGDVICTGQTITITGDVEGDVRVAGQNIVINSEIKNNVTVAGQNFTLGSGGSIGKDLTGGTDNMTLNGSIGRDILLGATTATINGSVGRNIKSEITNLSLGAGANVSGSINYASHNQLNKASEAVVAGKINRTEPKKEEPRDGWFGIGFRIYWFFAMLFVALVLVLLFPSLFESAASRTMNSFGPTLLMGIAATLFTPIVFVLLMATLVGIPLGLILMFAWIMALILSGPFFAYLIGKEIWRSQHNPVWIMLLGAVILLLVYNVPFIGFIVMLAALFIGMGMILRELTKRAPKPSYKLK